MKNFREMPFVRALLVALVVVFVWGVGMPGGAFARMEMQNGHEGDPLDGSDIVGGGGGDDPNGPDEPLSFKYVKSENIFDYSFGQYDERLLIPTLIEDELVWMVLIFDFGRNSR